MKTLRRAESNRLCTAKRRHLRRTVRAFAHVHPAIVSGTDMYNTLNLMRKLLFFEAGTVFANKLSPREMWGGALPTFDSRVNQQTPNLVLLS